MPLLGTLLSSLLTGLYGLIAAIVGAKAAIRVTAAVTLATIYVACVVHFTTLIGPWIGNIFTTGYGMLLGLLFPPIAGSVVASLSAYWICVAGQKYVTKLTKLAVG